MWILITTTSTFEQKSWVTQDTSDVDVRRLILLVRAKGGFSLKAVTIDAIFEGWIEATMHRLEETRYKLKKIVYARYVSGYFGKKSMSDLMKKDAELTTRDNGIGIPKDKIEHVLSPFGQDEDAQVMVKSEAGTGLGLVIVKQIVDMH